VVNSCRSVYGLWLVSRLGVPVHVGLPPNWGTHITVGGCTGRGRHEIFQTVFPSGNSNPGRHVSRTTHA